jgi:hypothetical protein
MGRFADCDDRTGDAFAEAGFIANFFQQGGSGNEDDVMAENADFEDGACSMAPVNLCSAGISSLKTHGN